MKKRFLKWRIAFHAERELNDVKCDMDDSSISQLKEYDDKSDISCQEFSLDDDTLHEECGVLVFLGMKMLQR